MVGSIRQGGSGKPHLSSSDESIDRVRYLQLRVGDHEWSRSNRGIMVSCGISIPYKLSGTTSSVPSYQGICVTYESLHCPSQVRQYFGSDLHQCSLQVVCSLAIEIWECCLTHKITLNLPGIANMIADQESRTTQDFCDWMLNPSVF